MTPDESPADDPFVQQARNELVLSPEDRALIRTTSDTLMTAATMWLSGDRAAASIVLSFNEARVGQSLLFGMLMTCLVNLAEATDTTAEALVQMMALNNAIMNEVDKL